jgi:hypothetical protein
MYKDAVQVRRIFYDLVSIPNYYSMVAECASRESYPKWTLFRVITRCIPYKEPDLLPNNLDLKTKSTSSSTSLSNFSSTETSTPNPPRHQSLFENPLSHNKIITMASPQAPNPTQEDPDQILSQTIPRIGTLLQQLQQRIDSGELPESAADEINDMMAEMQLQMDRISSEMAEQTAIMDARMAEKAEMIEMEEVIVGFLLGRE